jgi:hypothetical protein
MTELLSAEASLSTARAAYEVRPHCHGRYLRLIECENRYLRAELSTLRTMLAGLRKAALPGRTK